MDDRRAPPLQHSSRTAAKVAVALLIVIAIAGLVLAGLQSRGPAQTPAPAPAADATQQAVPPLTMTPASAPAEEQGVAANHISFAAASDSLTDAAKAKVVRIAETAKAKRHAISIASTVEARADRAQQLELARKRSMAIRDVLQANGIALTTMRIEIQEVPAGSVTAAAANQIALVFH